MLLDPGLNLTLRPLSYPEFYEGYKNAIKNTWTVDEVDFHSDLPHLERMSSQERHLVKRLVAFFATGDTIVANNLAVALYQHLNAPEARMYLGRQLYEEMLHVQFYLTLLDTYIDDPDERHQMFRAVEDVPSVAAKAEYCRNYMNHVFKLPPLRTKTHRKTFLRNLVAFGCFVEGLFFYAAFAYVYFLRSKGMLNGLASGTNWVFRDESMHMGFALKVIDTIKREEPSLWDDQMKRAVVDMAVDAVECERKFAVDLLGDGIAGLSSGDMYAYLQYVADRRLEMLGMPTLFGVKRNPLSFMELQDMQSLTNFFERRVADYQIAGDWSASGITLDEEF